MAYLFILSKGEAALFPSVAVPSDNTTELSSAEIPRQVMRTALKKETYTPRMLLSRHFSTNTADFVLIAHL